MTYLSFSGIKTSCSIAVRSHFYQPFYSSFCNHTAVIIFDDNIGTGHGNGQLNGVLDIANVRLSNHAGQIDMDCHPPALPHFRCGIVICMSNSLVNCS